MGSRAVKRQRERLERRRQIVIAEIGGNDPELLAELSTKTHAELVCLRNLDPMLEFPDGNPEGESS